MTQTQQQSTKTFTEQMRGLPAILVVAMFAILFLMLVFWNTTSTRITAIETRLAELTASPEQSMPTQSVQFEREHVTNDMEVETKRHIGNIDMTVQALSPPQKATEMNLRPTEETSQSSGLVEVRAESPLFEDGLQSLYHSLELTPERSAELGTGLEDLLNSIWPEYIALSKSPNTDTTALQQLYCSGAQSILTAQEVERLGC